MKNLKKNCIYRFYNEYDYKTNYESFIDYQSKINSEIKYINIDNISKSELIPNNFYSNNINISAIVGKNGSGKSGLLELIYAFNYNLSKHFNIEDFDKNSIPFCEINLELFFEVIDKSKSVFYKISHKSNKKFAEFNFYKQDNLSKKFIKLTTNYNTEEWEKFYYLVINYSLYGLNNLVNGEWISKVFHKNDGYQSPIVINPKRENGCININTEYNLAQSRLILSKYLLKDKYLLKGIDLGKIDYYLNIFDIQHNKKYRSESENLVIKEIIDLNKSLFPNNIDLNEFIFIIFKQEIIGINDLLSYLKYYVSETLEIKRLDYNYVSETDIKLIENQHSDLNNIIGELRILLNLNDKIFIEKVDNTLFKELLNDYLKKKQKEDLQYLCFLYIFKKIKKISQNYSEYKIYNFLFDERHNLSDMLWSELSSIKSNVIENYFDNKKDKSISLERISQLNEKELNDLKNLIIDNSIILFESLGFNYKQLQHNIDFSFEKKLNLYAINEDNILNENQFLELLVEPFINFINKNKQKVFIEYIDRLYKDESHITFKLRQVLSYFKFDIFDSITIKDYNEQKSSHEIEINKNYYEGKTLAEVPLSFFKPEINIVKNKDIYPFNRLSSGEQQMIHSLLNIKYHLSNLSSIKKDHILAYRNINIIFDEVELYFHPEYQKQFIFELIRHLKKLKEFKFNIIFATHSPFILSDIPSQNVLKLNEGISIPDKDGINSFGSNIHDLLADEFFLGNGFMGEFAASKIEKLIQKIKSKEVINESNYNKYLLEINLIGEKVLKYPLLELLEEKREKNKLDNNDLINFYQKQIDKLKNQ